MNGRLMTFSRLGGNVNKNEKNDYHLHSLVIFIILMNKNLNVKKLSHLFSSSLNAEESHEAMIDFFNVILDTTVDNL